MGAIASQITSLTIVYSPVYSDADQRKHQSSASLAFVRGIHRGPVNSPQKWPVTRKMFPFDDVIVFYGFISLAPEQSYNCLHVSQVILNDKLADSRTQQSTNCIFLGPLSLTWFNFTPSMVIICPVKCEMEFRIHSQTSTTAPLKFENG